MKNNLLWLALLGLMATSCEISTDGLTVNSGDIEIHAGGTSQIDAESSSKIVYVSGNDFHAEVSSDGLVTANRVGQTEIGISSLGDVESVRVEVLPNYSLYKEPIMDWSYSKSDIISELGEPDDVSDGGIMYDTDEEAVLFIMYMFDEQDKLITSSVVVDASSSNELDEFLLERYMFYTQQDDLLIYLNGLTVSDATMIVGTTPFLFTYSLVLYQENTTKKSTALNATEKVKAEAKKFVK